MKIEETARFLTLAVNCFKLLLSFTWLRQRPAAHKSRSLSDLQQACLSFTPSKVFYDIDVSWADAGEIFKTIKDALDTKYGSAQVSGGGFQRKFQYRDNQVIITLTCNNFGFGSNQTTSLRYVYQPAVADVDAMKKRIKQDIKQKNA